MTAWERIAKCERILTEAANGTHAYKAELAARKLRELKAQELTSTAELLRQYGGRLVNAS